MILLHVMTDMFKSHNEMFHAIVSNMHYFITIRYTFPVSNIFQK